MTVRRYILLFVLLVVVYHSNLRPIVSGDSLSASLIPFSVLLDGTVRLDRFAPYVLTHYPYGADLVHRSEGHWYSTYPITGPVLTAPLYLPLAAIPWVRRQPPGTLLLLARVTEKFVAVTLAAATALILLALLRRIVAERAAVLLTLAFALGTGVWSTASQALWQHTFGLVALAACFYGVERWRDGASRWFWLTGIFAGCACAIRPTNVVLLPALAAALWTQRARAGQWASVFLPAAAAGLITAAYNSSVFGSIAGGYPASLDGRFLAGLAGILVSPSRGLLIYTPAAAFAVAAVLPRAAEARGGHRPVMLAAAVFVPLQIALIAGWKVWWGGYCWGPRLLTEILLPVTILTAIGLAALGRSGVKLLTVAVLFGCLIQSVGVYCYPKGHWDNTSVNVDSDPARLWDWVDNPVTRTLRAGFVWEPYAIAYTYATEGLAAAARKADELGVRQR